MVKYRKGPLSIRGGGGAQGCNQHEHDEDAQPDQHVRQDGGHAGLSHFHHTARGDRTW